MTKQEIINNCSKDLSEDINGEFYSIYDASKLYDLAYDKGRHDAISERIGMDDFEADIYAV